MVCLLSTAEGGELLIKATTIRSHYGQTKLLPIADFADDANNMTGIIGLNRSRDVGTSDWPAPFVNLFISKLRWRRFKVNTELQPFYAQRSFDQVILKENMSFLR